MTIQSMQDITAAFDALLAAAPARSSAPALDVEAEFAALLAGKPAGAVQRTRPAFVFQDETGAIVRPTVARYMAGRINIVVASEAAGQPRH